MWSGTVGHPTAPEVDRVELAEAVESVGVHHRAGLEVVLASPGKPDVLERELPGRSAGQVVEHAHSLLNHLYADPVSRDHRDFEHASRAHRSTPPRDDVMGRTPAETHRAETKHLLGTRPAALLPETVAGDAIARRPEESPAGRQNAPGARALRGRWPTMSEPFHGIFPYLISPVDRSGRVREEVLRGLVERLVAGGVHGLSPLGSTGEFPYLTPAQRIEIVRITVDAARGRVPVVPGVAAYATHDAIDQVRRLLDLGIDGVVLILQTYFPLSPPRVLEYFSGVAEAVRCPIVLYSNPKLLGAELTPDHGVALSEIPNVRYFKEASGETGKILTVLNRTAGRMKVFSASAHIPLLVFRLGGVGWMAGPACLLPRECVALYELAQQGRWDEAERLQRRLWALNEVFQRYSLAACVKTGLALQGFDVGDPFTTVAPLGREATDDVRRALEAASTPGDEVLSAESAGIRGDGTAGETTG